MAITNAVIDFGNTQSFRHKTRMCYFTCADLVIAGTFHANTVTPADKNAVTAFASRVIAGGVDQQVLCDSLLATIALQNAINGTPVVDIDTVMLAQAKQQMKLLAGVVPVYS